MFDPKHVHVSLLKHKCLKVKHVSVSCFYSVRSKASYVLLLIYQVNTDAFLDDKICLEM